MERLTMASDKGGVAFTFDLDITCEKSEIEKILKLAEKLKEYEDLEEQGKLQKLPCAVGDTIFRINKGAKIPIISMEVHEISMFYSRTNNLVIQIKCHDDIDSGEIFYSDSEFGRTVFLTKSAAEQALKEMEVKENE